MNNMITPMLPTSAATVPASEPSEVKTPPASVATAVKEVTASSRSNLEKLLDLIPVDKQAEANSVLLDLLEETRNGSAPSRGSSKLSIAKGTRYRRSDRAPEGARSDGSTRI